MSPAISYTGIRVRAIKARRIKTPGRITIVLKGTGGRVRDLIPGAGDLLTIEWDAAISKLVGQQGGTDFVPFPETDVHAREVRFVGTVPSAAKGD